MSMYVTLYSRPISNDSDIVFGNDNVLMTSLSSYEIKGNIEQLTTKVYSEIDLPVSQPLANYAIVKESSATTTPVYHFFIENIEPVASKAGVCRYQLRRDTVKDFVTYGINETNALNTISGVFSALPFKSLDTRLMVRPTTMYEASRTFLSDNVLPDNIFFVQVTAVETSGNDNQYADYVQYWTLVIGSGNAAKPGNAAIVLGGSSSKIFFSPTLYDIINNIDDILPNVTAESVVDISISKRAPLFIKTSTFTYSGTTYTAYTLTDILKQIIEPTVYDATGAPVYASCWWSSNDCNPMIKNTSDTLVVDADTIGWSMVYTRDSDFKDVSDVYIYSENNVEICEIPPEMFDSSNKITIGVIPRLDLIGIYTDIRIGNTIYTMPEGHLPHTGSAWKTYQHDQMNLDREIMNLNINRTKSDAVLGASQSLVSGVMIGGLTTGGAAAASSAVGIAGNLVSAQMNIDNIRKEQAAQEANIRRLNGSSFNTGYGTGYIKTSILYGNCRISEHRPYGANSVNITRYIKDNGYPAVGYRSYSFTPGVNVGYIKGYAKMLRHTHHSGGTITEYPFTNSDFMRDFNMRLSKGVKIISQESDI